MKSPDLLSHWVSAVIWTGHDQTGPFCERWAEKHGLVGPVRRGEPGSGPVDAWPFFTLEREVAYQSAACQGWAGTGLRPWMIEPRLGDYWAARISRYLWRRQRATLLIGVAENEDPEFILGNAERVLDDIADQLVWLGGRLAALA